jgi:hypothetical protein
VQSPWHSAFICCFTTLVKVFIAFIAARYVHDSTEIVEAGVIDEGA